MSVVKMVSRMAKCDLIYGKMALIAANGKHEVSGACKSQTGNPDPSRKHVQPLQGISFPVVPEHVTRGGAECNVGGQSGDSGDRLLPPKAGQRGDSGHQPLHGSPLTEGGHQRESGDKVIVKAGWERDHRPPTPS